MNATANTPRNYNNTFTPTQSLPAFPSIGGVPFRAGWVIHYARTLLSLLIIISSVLTTLAQNVGISNTGATPDASAMLDVASTSKGVLLPRVALTASNVAAPIVAPLTSLLVYNTATAGIAPNDVKPGYYYWDGTKWVSVGSGTAWLLTGNAGTTPATNFVGTTDAQDFVARTNNTERMRVTTGGNVGIGTPTPNISAIVDITSTSQGFVMPRMTSIQRKAIAVPIAGLQVYDTNLKGIYIYDGAKWDCANNPAGTVDYFANVTAPNGYLECNGQSVSTTTYAELFAAIGYLYGGSGATFILPDLRGEFIRGADNGRGVDAARVLGSSQDATAIRILIDNYVGYPTGTYAVGMRNIDGVLAGAGSNSGTEGLDNTFYQSTATTLGGAGDNNAGKVRPRNVAMKPCIKF